MGLFSSSNKSTAVKSNGEEKTSDYDYGFGKEKVSNAVPSEKKEVSVSQEADF